MEKHICESCKNEFLCKYKDEYSKKLIALEKFVQKDMSAIMDFKCFCKGFVLNRDYRNTHNR